LKIILEIKVLQSPVSGQPGKLKLIVADCVAWSGSGRGCEGSMFNVNEEILIAPSGDVLSQDSLCWEILMLVLSSPSDHRAPV